MCVHNETGLFTMHVGRVLVGEKKRGVVLGFGTVLV